MNLLWWWPETESGVWYTRVLCCCPEGPHQDGEKEWQESVNAGATELESSKKKDLGVLVDSSWTRASNVFFLVLKNCNDILTCTKRSIVSRLLDSYPLLITGILCPVLGSSVKETPEYTMESSTNHQKEGLQQRFYKEWLRGLGCFRLWQREHSVYGYLKGECKDRTKLFPVVPRDRNIGNGNTWKFRTSNGTSRNTFLLWGLQGPSPWKYPKPGCASWASGFRWPWAPGLVLTQDSLFITMCFVCFGFCSSSNLF